MWVLAPRDAPGIRNRIPAQGGLLSRDLRDSSHGSLLIEVVLVPHLHPEVFWSWTQRKADLSQQGLPVYLQAKPQSQLFRSLSAKHHTPQENFKIVHYTAIFCINCQHQRDFRFIPVYL